MPKCLILVQGGFLSITGPHNKDDNMVGSIIYTYNIYIYIYIWGSPFCGNYQIMRIRIQNGTRPHLCVLGAPDLHHTKTLDLESECGTNLGRSRFALLLPVLSAALLSWASIPIQNTSGLWLSTESKC